MEEKERQARSVVSRVNPFEDDDDAADEGAPPNLPSYGLGDSDDDDNDAIDDEEADDEMVEMNRSITMERIKRRQSTSSLLAKVIPFHWAPMLTPLVGSNIEVCGTLERLAFADSERLSTKELMEYRIRQGGNLCFGLFNTYRPRDAEDWSIGTLAHSRLVETGREDNAKHVLFAHIIATLGQAPVVTDESMQYPDDWRSPKRCDPSPLGHKYEGRTICVHSLAVCPEVQGVGIGKAMMKSYLQLMNESQVADRVALICKPGHIDFFKKCGFQDAGKRESTSLEGEWHDMGLELPGPKEPPKDTTKPELSVED